MKKPCTDKKILLFAITIMACSITYSQVDTNKLQSLNLKDLLNVKITTASKTSQDLEMAPATVIVITQEQIKLRGYQSLLDVLYDLPDMKVDDKVRSHLHNNFVMRGTPGQEKFVILLDGMRISSPTNETMPILENYPVNLAEQIEIVLGPASALYGADAVSGVINLITKKSSSKKAIRVDATSMAGAYGYINNTLFIAKKLNEHANLVVSGQYCYNQGVNYSKLYKQDTLFNTAAYTTGTFNTIFGPMTPKTPVNSRIEMPLKAYNLYASLQVDEFSLAIFRNYAQTPTFYEENPNNAVYNKNVFMGQGITMANASYRRSFGKVTATTSLLASEYVMNPKSNYRNVFSGMEPAYKYSFGSLIKAEQQVDWKASEKFNLTGGATYESFYSIPTSADLAAPVDPLGDLHGTYIGTKTYYKPDGLDAKFYTLRYQNIGTYLQVQYSPVEKMHFTFGARYDVNSRYENTFNPRVGVVYRPTDKTTIKALYGTAFLAPTTFDCYAYYGAFETADSGRSFRANFMHLPNPNLQPITSKNAEVSINHYFTNNLSVTLDGYYTVLSGLHEFADDNKSTRLYNNMFNGIPVGYVEVFVNQTRQVNYGGSIQFNCKYSIGKLLLNSFLSVSHTNGYDDYSQKDPTLGKVKLEFISPFSIHAGTDLKAGKFSCSPRLILLGRQNLTGISNSTTSIRKRQTIPGYALMNVSLRYNIIKKLAVFTNINNALNQR
ncbi:MAG: TonB-dependent receptor plug domain-containing protein, partial [Niastella sp.]|uniref:TonB-dependent receptor plug domain-containing protein n=1 Tax=Niastella sp. TaxID=1869183 RepID=UPI00389A043E